MGNNKLWYGVGKVNYSYGPSFIVLQSIIMDTLQHYYNCLMIQYVYYTIKDKLMVIVYIDDNNIIIFYRHVMKKIWY